MIPTPEEPSDRPVDDPSAPVEEERDDMELLADGGETLLDHAASAQELELPPTQVRETPPTNVEGRSILTQLKTRLDSEAGIRLDDGEDSMLEGPGADRRYEEVGEIARGGMGAIVKIVDRDIRRPVAMKVILGDGDGGRLERFIEEAQVTGQLEHPNIVPVHELGLDPEGRVYFTMKLVKGSSLEDIIDRLARSETEAEREYSLNDLLLIFMKVCDAVAFAHSRKVTHRDLKPENIMVGRFGEVLVLDWGLAKVRGAPDRTQEELVATVRSEREITRTITGDVMGTPSYMPPEQADGRVEDIDARSDVFALGGILYRILTFEAPYTGSSLSDVLRKAVSGELIPPRTRSPQLGIPAELESICLKAMARKRSDRYQSVQTFIDDIRAYLDHRLVTAHRYSSLARMTRFVQRHTAAVMVVAVSLFLLAAGGAGTWIMATRADAERARADAQEAKARAQTLQKEKAEQDARVARRDATEARSALDKGRAVADVLLTAEVEFEPLLLELKRQRHSDATLEARLAFLAEKEKGLAVFEKTVKTDSASQAAWMAVKGWLLYLGGKEAEGLALFEASKKADPDVPYGALFSAMIHLVHYLEAIEFPRPYFDETMTPKYRMEIRETPGMKQARGLFEDAMRPLLGDQVWGRRDKSEFTALLDGFRGVQNINMGRAEKGITQSLRVTELRWIREELFLARMTARYLQWDKWAQAYEDAKRILFDMPDHARVHRVAGLILITVGGSYSYLNKKPDEVYALAVEHFEKARKIDSTMIMLPTFMSVATRQQGIYHYHSDGDPLPYYQRSLERAAEGISDLTGADAVYARVNRALTYQMRAKYLESKGKDGMPDFRSALADLDALLKAEPNSFSGRFSRGDLLRRIAGASGTPKGEAIALYRRALDDMKQAVRLGGGRAGLGYTLGKTHLDLAGLLYNQGKVPAKIYNDALKVSEGMLERDPGHIKGALNKCRALHGLSLCSLRSRDGKAMAWSKQASAAARHLLDSASRCWEAHSELGGMLALQGSLIARDRKDPAPLFREAEKAYGQAIKINPKDIHSLFQRARVRRVLAHGALRKKQDGTVLCQGAVEDMKAVLLRNSWQSAFHQEHVAALEALADALLAKNKNPRQVLAEAAEACLAWEKAVPGDGSAVLRRGLVRAQASEIEAPFAGDETALAEHAVVDLTKVLEKTPKSSRALSCLTDRLMWLGRFEEARKALSKAEPFQGREGKQLSRMLREVTAVLEQPPWARTLWLADLAYKKGAWARADRFYRKGRTQATEARISAHDQAASRLATALFNHACVLAQVSQGRHGQRGWAKIPSEKTAALLRDALAALDEAVSMGVKDVSPVEKHPWLDPVRKMKEYPEHLARWKK